MAERDAAVTCAIRAVGEAQRLAKAIGVSPQALSQWKRCPASRVLKVEEISGVPRHVLRPDLYPAPEPAQ